MNAKRFIPACLAVFVFIFLFEWVLHHKILVSLYIQSAMLWRMPEDMKNFFHWIIIGQLFGSIMFCYIFLKGYENKGIVEGFRYGILIGLLFAPYNLIMYAVQPLPSQMVAIWIAGGLLECMGAGIILAAIYRPLKT